jgi:hypothetical protein
MSRAGVVVSVFVGLAITVACSGDAPTTPEAVDLLQSQGWLCTTTTNPLSIGQCGNAGIAEQQRRYTVIAKRAGTATLHATYRDVDYEEYFKPSLTCGGRAQPLTLTSSREQLPPPSWFSEHLGSWPAADATYSATLGAASTCELVIAFDLRSPPFSAFDIGVMLH